SLLKDGSEIIPFNRSGEKPVIAAVEREEDHLDQVKKLVGNWLNKGHETIAVICRSAKESKAVYEKLKDNLDVRLMID
ncbi:hypothetical protein ICJ84_16805, partial [Aestuariibaculum suncheonense]|nr:hypothetical protein [Aestuariibaculum suncheonense]